MFLTLFLYKIGVRWAKLSKDGVEIKTSFKSFGSKIKCGKTGLDSKVARIWFNDPHY